MGMDVTGRKPTAPAGEYFQANVCAWHPIHALMAELCGDLLSKKLLRAMAFNDRAGPKTQKTCTEMAARFEGWMEHHAEGLVLEQDEVRVTSEGRVLLGEALVESSDQETFSPYRVSDEYLKRWIEFLRHCGGFRVW